MTASKSEIWHGTNLKIGEKKMKKYRLFISSKNDLKELNKKIAIDSLFTVGETITNNPLHVGINVVTDERIINSVKELAQKRGYCTHKNYLSVDDDLCGYRYAICSGHREFKNRQYLEVEWDNLPKAINDIWNWRRSGLNYDYYILDTDNNKVLDY